MHHIDFLSPAQLVGYLSLVLGVTAFSQKVDKRLKLFNSLESMSNTVHFLLLGNPPAVVSCVLASGRSMLAIRIRSLALAVIFIVANLGMGLYVLKSPWGLLPIIGSCGATWAAFMMKGIPLRVVFLCSTLCWLANNILSGSVGGTLLESFITTASCITIARMLIDNARSRGSRVAASAGN